MVIGARGVGRVSTRDVATRVDRKRCNAGRTRLVEDREVIAGQKESVDVA